MAIEFACVGCGQRLRVSDDSAGKRAKCPKCQHVVDIPVPDMVLEDELPISVGEPPPLESPFGQAGANPYSAPQQSSFPVGGSPYTDGKIVNTEVEIGSILNHALQVWQENLGILIGATVIVMAISLGVSYALELFSNLVAGNVGREAGILVYVLGSMGRLLIDVYLGIGLAQITLGLSRRQRVEFSQLFNGGARLLPTLGVSILFGLAVFGGLLLFIVPAIIVAPYVVALLLLVVDDKSTVADSFGLAREITQRNFLTTFLIWLLGMGISVLGFMACCVGIIAAAPLVAVMWATGYLMMSGQIPVQPTAAAGKTYF